MATSSLERFVDRVKAAWGPLASETVASCQRLLGELAGASTSEPWLAALQRDPPEDAELYRDPEHGFLLLTHGEQQGRYRIPHDHGSGWVIYAVQRGEMEMRSYARITEPDGKLRLVRRDAYRLRAGDCSVYLPGDIHDTRCVSSSVLMLRFTSCDLKTEDSEGRMNRYLEHEGLWNVAVKGACPRPK